MSPYGLFLLLEGKRVLVVGGGPVAAAKARELHAHGAHVVVVAPDVVADLEAVAAELHRRPFVPQDVEGAYLVIAAAPPPVNREVRHVADQRAVFVVAVDDVASCTAYGAARLERGGLTIAISSSGTAPALVALLRRALEAVIPDDVERWREVAENARSSWKAAGIPIEERRPILLRALDALYDKTEASSSC
ncbi:Siroheme synthase / Precorrin-2 oxidase [Labilithrix luteola]|uniref:precorrin-2 dehydrogenase n=1 Tax=Labilithrix luteola TaxID=1391654 RepID=A0A0K1PJ90_9BACT|nr:NAD(P)-dependent oxidoreductase [Labilithrix luteola]AKU93466.1 Siroheme synthase / Precorrin-2 oxidase [Labilithrix luteola]